MKEMKKFDKWIGILSISVISIVAIVFVVVISDTHLSKGTYAASDGIYVLDAGSTYTLPSEITAYEGYTCQITEYTSCSGLSGYRAKKSCWSCVEESALTCWCNDFSHECSWSSSTPGALYYAVTNASQAVSSCGAKPSGQMVTNYYLSDTKPTNGTCTSKAYSSCSGVSGYFAMNCFLCTKAASGTSPGNSESGSFCKTAGKYFQDDTETCETCPKDYYCPGDGSIKKCPSGTTSVAGSEVSDDCKSSGTSDTSTNCSYTLGNASNSSVSINTTEECCSKISGSWSNNKCYKSVTATDAYYSYDNLGFSNWCATGNGYHLWNGKCIMCQSGYVSDDTKGCVARGDTSSEKTVTLTFKSNDGKSTLGTKACTIPANSNGCASDLVAPSGSIPEISGKVFNGWGESAGCTAGSYTANATFAITRDSSNRTYYACYKTADSGNKPADFDSSKCSYSALTAVTRDERYLNCKYTNISYNNDQSADTAATIQACCQAKGYTWVGSNFTSSGFGNEYCIVCSGGTTPGGNGGDSTPGSSTDTGACYLVNHKYVWSANSLSGGTLVNSITSKSNCSGCEKGYTLNSSNNCVKSSSSSTTPSNSSSKEPTNPQTGMTGIVLAWIIGLLAIGYSFWYFKRTSTN